MWWVVFQYKQKLTIKTDVSVSSWRHCQGEVKLQSLRQGVTIEISIQCLKLKALINEDTLLPMMFLVLRKLRNICCGHKMFLNKIRNISLCPGHKICIRNKCCACGQMGKHLCRQQCVCNNVSSFAMALSYVNTFARIESLCTFRVGFRSLMKSIAFTKQSNLFLHFFRTLKRLRRSFGTSLCCSW